MRRGAHVAHERGGLGAVHNYIHPHVEPCRHECTHRRCQQQLWLEGRGEGEQQGAGLVGLGRGRQRESSGRTVAVAAVVATAAGELPCNARYMPCQAPTCKRRLFEGCGRGTWQQIAEARTAVSQRRPSILQDSL